MRLRKRFFVLTIIFALCSLAACGQQNTEAQPSVQESVTGNNITDDKKDTDIEKRTTESLKPYLDYIGKYFL